MPGMKGPEDQSYQPGIGGESLDKFGNPVDPLLGSMDLPIADFGDVTKFGVQKGSGKFTDLKRTRDPSMDPNFMNLSPQEQDKKIQQEHACHQYFLYKWKFPAVRDEEYKVCDIT